LPSRRRGGGAAHGTGAVEPGAGGTGGLPGLLLAEGHRFASRRFIRWLLGLAVLGYVVVVPLVGITQFSRTTEEVRAQARADIAQIVAEQNRYREDCVRGPVPQGFPADASPDEYCPPVATPAEYSVNDFLPKQSFDLADYLQPGAVAVGAAVAALAFVVGATWIGAEWSARTMMALLFWETRRLRVLGAKTAVLVAVTAVVAALAQLAWALSAVLLAKTRGSTAGLPKGFWGDVAALGGRSVLLAVFTALLGMGVAHLIRSTGAALGVAFVYFAVLETAVGSFRPGWQEWLLATNAVALVTKGGLTISVPSRTVDSASGQFVEFTDKNISNLHGGLVIGTVVLLLLGVGGWLFRRRDLT
jgi:ABC-type transport system involved in multi-copper enzyme maturation permease subunit